MFIERISSLLDRLSPPKIYNVFTAHGSQVYYNRHDNSLFHGHVAGRDPLLALRITDTTALFLIFDTETDGKPYAGVSVCARAQVEPNEACVILDLSRDERALFVAAPARAGADFVRLTSHLDSDGPSSKYTLVERTVFNRKFLGRLRRRLVLLSGKAYGHDEIFSRITAEEGIENQLALEMALYGLTPVRTLLECDFDRYGSKLERYFEPDDVWGLHGLPAVAAWNRTRPLEHRVRVGPELDGFDRGYAAQPTIGRIWNGYLRGKTVPTRATCIVATARNEGPFLLEWIAYHRSIGFEHIFIYTNDNDDDSDRIYEILADSGIVTWLDNKSNLDTRPQLKSYGHALGGLAAVLDFEWCLIIDLDEFMVLDAGRFSSVSDYLRWQSTTEVHAVALNWLMFGINGRFRIDPGRTVTECFTHRRKEVDSHIKTIFKTKYFDHSHCHYPFPASCQKVIFKDSDARPYLSDSEFANSVHQPDNNAWINHYYCRSFEDALLKCYRGEGDRILQTTPDLVRVTETAFARTWIHERGSPLVIDDRIVACAPGLRSRIERLEALPGMRAALAAMHARTRARIDEIGQRILGLEGETDSAVVRHVISVIKESR